MYVLHFLNISNVRSCDLYARVALAVLTSAIVRFSNQAESFSASVPAVAKHVGK